MATFPANLPLVAIVTPVLNGEAFLQAAMDSVQAQTYPNIIHIVLDNASIDGTRQLLEAFDAHTVPVSVYRNDVTLPITDNWDHAFSFVPSDAVYVKLHCADDLMHATCIAKFVDISEQHPDVQVVSCHDVYCETVRRANLPINNGVVDGKVAARMIMDRSICWLPYQHLFGRLDSEDRGKPFFGTHKVGADPYAMVRMVLRGSLGYIKEPLVYTRRHGQNFSDRLATVGSTPVTALQINMMLITYFEIMLAFGKMCWSDEAYVHAKTFARNNIARTAIKWRLQRYHRALHDLTASLEAVDRPLTLVNYIGAVMNLPAYLVWIVRKKTKVGPAVDTEYFQPNRFRADMIAPQPKSALMGPDVETAASSI
ncbi:glycosyltransferase family 2 protein [Sphingomonas sp. 22L2VL55-3]